ncbi:MAG: hypothetical protein ABI910_22760, partial [Gemmatimonadota bacterium]
MAAVAPDTAPPSVSLGPRNSPVARSGNPAAVSLTSTSRTKRAPPSSASPTVIDKPWQLSFVYGLVPGGRGGSGGRTVRGRHPPVPLD